MNDDSLKEYIKENPNDRIGWSYFSFMIMNKSGKNEVSLNILSQALESNPNCELIQSEYLNIYSKMKKLKKLKDFNEVCLMAIDNCPIYTLFWKVT